MNRSVSDFMIFRHEDRRPHLYLHCPIMRFFKTYLSDSAALGGSDKQNNTHYYKLAITHSFEKTLRTHIVPNFTPALTRLRMQKIPSQFSWCLIFELTDGGYVLLILSESTRLHGLLIDRRMHKWRQIKGNCTKIAYGLSGPVTSVSDQPPPVFVCVFVK